MASSLQVRSIECQDCRWHSTLHIRDYCEGAQSYIANPRCAAWCVYFEARPEDEEAEE